MNPVSARLLNQQLICHQFSFPHDVVEWMGAMQAQEYRMMRWAAGMRTIKPSAKAFEADYNAGRIVRGHLFRTTWQLVAGEDWRWMQDLCRVNALRGMSGWMKSNGISIPEAEQDAIQQIFSDYLTQNRIAQKVGFALAVKEKGITMDEHRLSYHIRLAEYSGLLCSGDLFPMKHSYALVEDKLPRQNPIPRDEALALLARKYFRSHGPATLEDFVWWTGLNISDCKSGMDAIQSELIEERWKGLRFFLHQDSRTRGFRSGTVILLPPYDEYLIGYKSRHVALHPDHTHRAHNNRGIFWPVILLDGEVVGNWSVPGGKLQTDIFHPEALISQGALDEQLRKYESFLKR